MNTQNTLTYSKTQLLLKVQSLGLNLNHFYQILMNDEMITLSASYNEDLALQIQEKLGEHTLINDNSTLSWSSGNVIIFLDL